MSTNMDDFQAIDRLNDYLDAFAQGQPAAEGEVDPESVRVDRRLRSLDNPPEPRPAFGDRLWEDLMQTMAQPAPMPVEGSLRHGRTGHAPSLRSIIALPHGRTTPGTLALAQLATAALLVLALGSVFVAFGGTGWDQITGSRPNHEVIPAPFATPGDPAGITSEPVFTVTFPDETIPLEGTYYVDLVVSTWPSGAKETAAPRPDDYGPVVMYVLDGTLGYRADGPLQVIRADGSMEDVVPGTEVVVGPGEATLLLKTGTGSVYRNPGSTPLRFLVIGVIDGLDMSRYMTEGGAAGTFTSMHPGDWLKEGPVAATVRRVTAAPGTTLPALDPTVSTSLYVESGTLTWEVVDGETGASTPTSFNPMDYDAGSWVSWVTVAPERKLIMSNTGAEPLVYLEITVAPLATEGSGA